MRVRRIPRARECPDCAQNRGSEDECWSNRIPSEPSHASQSSSETPTKRRTGGRQRLANEPGAVSPHPSKRPVLLESITRFVMSRASPMPALRQGGRSDAPADPGLNSRTLSPPGPCVEMPGPRPRTVTIEGGTAREIGVHDGCMQHRLPALFLACLALVACGPAKIPVSAGGGSPADGTPKLLIRLDEDNDERGVGQHVADYLTDGSVIRLNAAGLTCLFGPSCGQLESNTLTPAGVATMQGLLDDNADLLGQPGTFALRPKPNVGSPLRADIEYTFVIERADGSRYTVSAPSLRSRNADKWGSTPDIDRLNALAEAMIDPVTVVGSDGLSDRVWKEDPSTMVAVFVRFSEVSPFIAEEHMVPDIKSTGWPFEGEADSFGTSFTGTDGATRRCGFVSRADIKTALAGWSIVGGNLLEPDLTAGHSWGSSALLWRAENPTTTLGVRVVPLLPVDSSASCADAMTY